MQKLSSLILIILTSCVTTPVSGPSPKVSPSPGLLPESSVMNGPLFTEPDLGFMINTFGQPPLGLPPVDKNLTSPTDTVW